MYHIGIDLGGTNIAAGIVDKHYKILEKANTPTLGNRPAEDIVKDIVKLCNDLCKESKIELSDVSSIGIAAPGNVDPEKGVVIYANNLDLTNFPLVDRLRERLHIANIFLENDANAAVLGEALAGSAQGYKSVVMITLGTGVGSGILIDGKLLTGFNNAAGELGHMVIHACGEPCTCGRKGCWEMYSSATGLIRMTEQKVKECTKLGVQTIMSDLIKTEGKITGQIAFEGKRLGDHAANETVEEYIQYLACGLANTINIFQPEVLCIGGGISNEGQYLLDLLVPLVRKQQYGAGLVSDTKIRIATLKNDAGIIGSAFLHTLYQ